MSTNWIATPLRIYINETGVYEMEVLCPSCGAENVHVLNHAMKRGYKTSVIEFGDLGLWHCHSFSCKAKYRFFEEKRSNLEEQGVEEQA